MDSVFSTISGSTEIKGGIMNEQSETVKKQDFIKSEYLQSDITGRIITAALNVHRNLGPGFREVIYQRALVLELPIQEMEFSREVWIDINYRGQKVGRHRVDFIIEEVMLEVKAKAQIEDVDVIQALSYLKSSGYEIGLLLNFGSKKLGIKRLINLVENN
jgi:GxxExxY protein